MYKRGTFGASCPSLRSRFGVIVTENEKDYWLTVKMISDERGKENPFQVAYHPVKRR